ncbi:MAG: histidinol-phosphate transaminase [Chryseobacterium sp.]|nr:histidinol-phosphate transaminase [Chryseobacterium sp.]
MEFNIKTLIRENIKNLVPYSTARDEFTSNEGVFLDANENPYGNYNRYPDPYQKLLKSKIAELKNIKTEQIFLGNGSDEVIDLLLRIFAEPGKDKILVFKPTYGMYQVSANINDVEVLNFPLDKNFQIDFNEDLECILEDKNLKLVFICSPNNPSGNLIERETIERILIKFKGIVVIDEAYEDFSKEKSWLSKVNIYKHLVVMQTFSKAWGMAGLRVGMAFAQEEIIALMNKVKPPYNISILNQNEVLNGLSQEEKYSSRLKEIMDQRIFLEKELQNFSFIVKIFPSDANFLLLEVEDANKLYDFLVNQKIIIRNRNTVVRNAVRITIGSPEENRILLESLQKF